MSDRRFLRVAAALFFFESSQAIAADVVTLRCDYPSGFSREDDVYDIVIADQRGISVKQYRRDKGTGKLTYLENYTENKKTDTLESYYRINSVEIAWGSTFTFPGQVIKLDATIDLRQGTLRNNSMIINRDKITERPVERATCKPN